MWSPASIDPSTDLVPHAVVGLPLSSIAKGRFKLYRGEDDLDRFKGQDFQLRSHRTGSALAFALRRYDGHPPDTFSVYVDWAALDPEWVVDLVLRDLQIEEPDLIWRRTEFDPVQEAAKRRVKRRLKLAHSHHWDRHYVPIETVESASRRHAFRMMRIRRLHSSKRSWPRLRLQTG